MRLRRLIRVVLVAIGSALTHLSSAAAEGPSLTALSAANYRAAHQFLDQPVVFADPLALRILGAAAATSLRENPGRFQQAASLRAQVGVRSRFAEDELARFGDPELICLNVNTPADLERAAAVIAG